MSAHFEVRPSQLQSAASTLRRVRSELHAGNGLGAGGLSGEAVGEAELSAALADFCQSAGTTAAALAQAVTLAAEKTARAGSAYEQTEAANMQSARP